MKREHISGLVVLGVIAVVVYYFVKKQPGSAVSLALTNAWNSVQNAVSNAGGGSRQVAAMPDPATMSTTPTYVTQGVNLGTNPAGIDPGIGMGASQAILAGILNAPSTTVIAPGGNNGDVIPAIQRGRQFMLVQ